MDSRIAVLHTCVLVKSCGTPFNNAQNVREVYSTLSGHQPWQVVQLHVYVTYYSSEQ